MKQSLEVSTVKSELSGKIKVLKDLFQIKLPTLKQLELLFDKLFVVAYLNKWIYDTIAFFNLGKNMNETQVLETSLLIIEKYPFLGIQDIYFIFREAKTLKYGKLYDRLDGQIILEWFKMHWDERLSAAENLSEQEHIGKKERPGESYSMLQDAKKHKYNIEKLANKYKTEF